MGCWCVEERGVFFCVFWWFIRFFLGVFVVDVVGVVFL